MVVKALINKSDVITNPNELPEFLPSLALAYIGDVVYELEVRKYILSQGARKVDALHKSAVKLVCANKQAQIARFIEENLTEKELGILKRGRNAKGHNAPKSTSACEYRLATGLECLVGYWYLAEESARLDWFFNEIGIMENLGEVEGVMRVELEVEVEDVCV